MNVGMVFNLIPFENDIFYTYKILLIICLIVQLGPRPSQKNKTLVLDQGRNFNPEILEMARVGLG